MMMQEIKRTIGLFALLMLSLLSAGQNSITLQPVPGDILSPVAAAHAGDGSGRVFFCEQHGVVRIMKGGVIARVPFLDIRDRIISQFNVYTERGLLGIAFHPAYKINRKFYVYYSASSKKRGSDHKSIVAEYVTSASNADVADKGSERIVMEIEQPESNHNGGQMAFGPDGYLYIGLGDGGGAGDDHGKTGNGQDMETLLGKIIRIDVNAASGYKIPPDNPFVGKPGRDEVWASGLRNPWKFSFDKITGKLFCADVGQDKYEEVDIIQKGKNYGWRTMEGAHCFDPKNNCSRAGLEMPVAEYSHDEGICITGGYVYRGAAKSYYGRYVFADWSGKLFMLTQLPDHTWKRDELRVAGQGMDLPRINSLAEDEKGELYLLSQKSIGPAKKGVVYRVGF